MLKSLVQQSESEEEKEEEEEEEEDPEDYENGYSDEEERAQYKRLFQPQRPLSRTQLKGDKSYSTGR